MGGRGGSVCGGDCEFEQPVPRVRRRARRCDRPRRRRRPTSTTTALSRSTTRAPWRRGAARKSAYNVDYGAVGDEKTRVRLLGDVETFRDRAAAAVHAVEVEEGQERGRAGRRRPLHQRATRRRSRRRRPTRGATLGSSSRRPTSRRAAAASSTTAGSRCGRRWPSSSSSSLCSAPSAAARATGCAGGRTGRRLTTTTTAAPRRRCCRRRSACERAKCVGYSGEGDGEGGGVADRCVHEDHHFYGRRDI